MINPYLDDRVERVGRDPERKLGWDDRLIGTIRLALRHGIQPQRYAFGAAAALAFLEPAYLESGAAPLAALDELWREAAPAAGEREAVLAAIETGLGWLRNWHAAGHPDLEQSHSTGWFQDD
jgi:mannitol-1-phosphate 5-dehydrogenase